MPSRSPSSRELLSQLRVARPCKASWDEMEGDVQRRFCGQCKKHVYDVSAMSEADVVELLLRKRFRACVRLHRRADGTVVTGDCARGSELSSLAFASMVVAGTAAGAVLGTAHVPVTAGELAPVHPMLQEALERTNAERALNANEEDALLDPDGAETGEIDAGVEEDGESVPPPEQR